MKTKRLLLVLLSFFLFNQCTPKLWRESRNAYEKRAEAAEARLKLLKATYPQIFNFPYKDYIGQPVGTLLEDLNTPYKDFNNSFHHVREFYLCGCDFHYESDLKLTIYISDYQYINASIIEFADYIRLSSEKLDLDAFKKEKIAGIRVVYLDANTMAKAGECFSPYCSDFLGRF